MGLTELRPQTADAPKPNSETTGRDAFLRSWQASRLAEQARQAERDADDERAAKERKAEEVAAADVGFSAARHFISHCFHCLHCSATQVIVPVRVVKHPLHSDLLGTGSGWKWRKMLHFARRRSWKS
jgi:hypothetical protein